MFAEGRTPGYRFHDSRSLRGWLATQLGENWSQDAEVMQDAVRETSAQRCNKLFRSCVCADSRS